MIDTFEIFEDLSKIFDENSARVMTRTLTKIYQDLSQMVTKEEFRALTQTVDRLANAQEKTEQRLDELTKAQEQTEKRLDALAKAQEQTEKRLDALAKAQEQTENVVRRLVKDMDAVKKQLGGLSDAVGYGLEDRLFPVMPEFILKKYGYQTEIVERKNLIYPSGKYDEINIYIEAQKNGQKKLFIAECKAKPGKKDVRRFDAMLQRIQDHLHTEVQGMLIGYVFAPEVENYLTTKYEHLDFYKTYELKRIAEA